MATPSRCDLLVDHAQRAREDALGITLDAQHALHNSMTALRAAWDILVRVESSLAGPDEHGAPGPIFVALADLREMPAARASSEEVAS